MAKEVSVGLIGLDTSHVTHFTRLLNDPEDPHHVPGGKVVAAFPGGSADFELSISRVDDFTTQLRNDYSIEILDSPEAVAEKVDIVFITTVDGRAHLDHFKKVVGYRKPTFIDKPLAVCSADAREIYRLADEAGIAVTSSSSLRFADNLIDALTSNTGDPIVGCDVCGPMDLQETQPGLFWYGIHAVDILMSIMKPGCKEVRVFANDAFDLVTAVWADGRVGTIRGHRRGHQVFGATIHREENFESLNLRANERPTYASMLATVLPALSSGKSAVPPEETLDVIRMIEAANESRESGKAVCL